MIKLPLRNKRCNLPARCDDGDFGADVVFWLWDLHLYCRRGSFGLFECFAFCIYLGFYCLSSGHIVGLFISIYTNAE
jgi:hypothetical protein